MTIGVWSVHFVIKVPKLVQMIVTIYRVQAYQVPIVNPRWLPKIQDGCHEIPFQHFNIRRRWFPAHHQSCQFISFLLTALLILLHQLYYHNNFIKTISIYKIFWILYFSSPLFSSVPYSCSSPLSLSTEYMPRYCCCCCLKIWNLKIFLNFVLFRSPPKFPKS